MINDLQILKQDLIRIENRKTFLVDIPTLHPDSPKYIKLWTEYTKHCIEGLWGYDSGGWRFMPPTLFFYGNFYKIVVTNEEDKMRIVDNPEIRDIDWIIHYAYMEAQGFSGWSEDNDYSSDEALLDKNLLEELKTNSKKQKRYLSLLKSNGEYKTYISPRTNLKKLHTEKKGKPLYHNESKNLMLFGSRGGGKSYTVSSIAAHILTFDGLKVFEKRSFEKPPKGEVCIGASDTDKSGDLCNKIQEGLNCFYNERSLGVWGSFEDNDFTPMPFYRDFSGTMNAGNKKNPFRYKYKVLTKAGEGSEGSGTCLYHVNYSDKKQGGAQAAAGGRYLLCVYEEVGLQSNFVDSLLSNVATVSDKGGQFGVQLAIGTSGNIDLVQQTRKVFESPKDYNFIAFDDIWEHSGKIGLFLPSYLTNVNYKDENGNTKLEEALEYYAKRRAEANAAADPEVLRIEKMNYPLVPSDMWTTNKGHYFPIMESLDREKELLKDDLYKRVGTPKTLVWDSKQPYGVRADLDEKAEPFYAFPYDRGMSKLDGAIMIYEDPQTIRGEIPNDMYIFVLDPYVSENVENGGSLGVLFGFLNPKYTKEGFNGNSMVCSYIGKHPNGKDSFYENVEKILAYYGNPYRGLWYEENRGDSVRGYFIRKQKTNLLAFTPTKEKGSKAYEHRVVEYGIKVYGQTDKLDMIGDTHEWLLSKTFYKGQEKRIIETIPCIFTIRQMINFEIKKHSNFDAVSALILYPLVLKELEHTKLQDEIKKTKHNPLAHLSVNPNIFKRYDSKIQNYEYNNSSAKQHPSWYQ